MVLNALNIPFSHASGEFRAGKLSCEGETLEIRRLDLDMIEYINPATGRLVRLYEVADNDFAKMMVSYNADGKLESITLPTSHPRMLRTVWQRCSDPRTMLLDCGDYFCTEVLRNFRQGDCVSRLFADFTMDETPSFSVILASPEDVQEISADQSALYPSKMRKYVDSEYMKVILAGAEEPVEVFKEFVRHTTDRLTELLTQNDLVTDDFCVVSEEYD